MYENAKTSARGFLVIIGLVFFLRGGLESLLRICETIELWKICNFVNSESPRCESRIQDRFPIWGEYSTRFVQAGMERLPQNEFLYFREEFLKIEPYR